MPSRSQLDGPWQGFSPNPQWLESIGRQDANYIRQQLLSEPLLITSVPVLAGTSAEHHDVWIPNDAFPTHLQGGLVLEVVEVTDAGISAQHMLDAVTESKPIRQTYRDVRSDRPLDLPRGMLRLLLTDGFQQVCAMEYKPCPQLSVRLPAGSKILVKQCRILRGVILLTKDNNVLMTDIANMPIDAKALITRLRLQLRLPLDDEIVASQVPLAPDPHTSNTSTNPPQTSEFAIMVPATTRYDSPSFEEAFSFTDVPELEPELSDLDQDILPDWPEQDRHEVHETTNGVPMDWEDDDDFLSAGNEVQSAKPPAFHDSPLTSTRAKKRPRLNESDPEEPKTPQPQPWHLKLSEASTSHVKITSPNPPFTPQPATKQVPYPTPDKTPLSSALQERNDSHSDISPSYLPSANRAPKPQTLITRLELSDDEDEAEDADEIVYEGPIVLDDADQTKITDIRDLKKAMVDGGSIKRAEFEGKLIRLGHMKLGRESGFQVIGYVASMDTAEYAALGDIPVVIENKMMLSLLQVTSHQEFLKVQKQQGRAAVLQYFAPLLLRLQSTAAMIHIQLPDVPNAATLILGKKDAVSEDKWQFVGSLEQWIPLDQCTI